MMIDMNDLILTVNEVKKVVLESVNVWKNYNKPESVKGKSRGPCVQKRPRDEECF